MQSNKRTFLRLCSLGVVGAFAGCSGDGGGGDTDSPSPTQTESQPETPESTPTASPTPTEEPTETPTETPTPEPEPSVEVTDVESTGLVQIGDPATVTLTLENTGDGVGTPQANFSLGEETVEREIEVPPNETVTATIEIPTGSLSTGLYEATGELPALTLSRSVNIIRTDGPGLYASIISDTDTSVEGAQALLVGIRDGEAQEVSKTIGETGTVTFEHPYDVPYSGRLFFVRPRTDAETFQQFGNLPIFTSLDPDYEVENLTELATQYSVPRGFSTDLRLVDGDGNGITGVPLLFQGEGGYSTEFGSYVTDGNGFLVDILTENRGIYAPPADRPEEELRVFGPQIDPQELVEIGTVSGSSDDEAFEIEINPDRFLRDEDLPP